MANYCALCGKKKPILFKCGFKNFRGNTYCNTCLEKAKRNSFCQEIEPFVSENLAKEFYYNQHYSICNFANYGYGLILYGESPLEVIFLTPSQIDYINLEMYNAMSEIIRMRRIGTPACSILSNELFAKLQEIKKETDANGPTSNIDFKLEEYWSARSGERIKEYQLPPADLV